MQRFFWRIYHLKTFSQQRKIWIILSLCFIFVLLRLPSLIEPHWYADEGIYQVVGRAIVAGRTLYKDIWDNKPPLLYLIYAVVNGNLFLVKFLSLLSGLFSVIMFFLLSKKLLKTEISRYIATAFFVFLFGSPLLEGNIANAENFMLLPIMSAGYLVLMFSERKKLQYILLAGFLLSLAFMTKIVAIFDFIAFFIFLIGVEYDARHKISVKKYVGFFISFSLVFILFIIYFILTGAFQDFISAVFLQNVSYVGEQNKFIFPMGALFFKTILLLIGVAIIIFARSKFTKATLFLYLWILFSIYNAFFSERPYIHYLLVIVPSFAFLVGHMLENAKVKLVDIFIVVLVIFFALYHFQIYYKTISYYGNYVSFLTNGRNITEYESFFDRNTPRDYEIASFIRVHTSQNEPVFLWSDSAQIYALSNRLPLGKYIVSYHIIFYKNADKVTKQEIEQSRPRYIIQTIERPLLGEVLLSYRLRYMIEGAKIYERQI